MNQAIPCQFCSNPRLALKFDARGIPGPHRFSLFRCPHCGLGSTLPVLADAELSRWYPSSYYGKENVRFNTILEKMVRLFRRRRARMISRYSRPGPVLDVGCGRGFILKNLKDLGFEPYGVELTETAAWHARHRLGIEVHVGDFSDVRLHPAGFQAVIFWHSLEHMTRPLEALAHAHKLLKPGGLLVVAVPNLDSFQARWLGPAWFHLDIPRHTFHFSAASLDALLRRAGFEIAKADHFSFEQNPYGWLQSLYNAMGFEFNFFYNLLKNKTSRSTPLKKHPFQALAGLALLPLLVPLSIALTVLETIMRRGGTVEIYALKK